MIFGVYQGCEILTLMTECPQTQNHCHRYQVTHVVLTLQIVYSLQTSQLSAGYQMMCQPSHSFYYCENLLNVCSLSQTDRVMVVHLWCFQENLLSKIEEKSGMLLIIQFTMNCIICCATLHICKINSNKNNAGVKQIRL